jgi:uncharacterized protein
MEPLEAVPLMMACSIGVQSASLWALRHNIRWSESIVLVIGGLVGVPIAVWLLRNVDATDFRVGFGGVVAVYAGYMLCGPSLKYLHPMHRGRNVLVGFGGGLIGGLTAMPGALPTIWCDLNGVPKNQQRGLIQPFIAAMQIFALVIMIARNELSPKVVVDLALSLPALMMGSVLGIIAFRNVNEVTFRRIILLVLLLSSVLLIV